MKIAVGGFQHETNTFAPTKADWTAFEQADSWPGLQMDAALLSACEGMNIPLGGFVEEALSLGHSLEPLVWCSATPSAHVTEDAYEGITSLMLDRLAKLVGDMDAVYLDLHGAMVTEHLEDGEGVLLKRVREFIGPDTWLVASLDLHANVTREMVDAADYLTAYRTYPHIDMGATGQRAAQELGSLQKKGVRPAKAFRKLDFLIPLAGSCTLVEPAASVYARISAQDDESDAAGQFTSTSFATGFSPADIHECGPSIVAYAPSQEAAEALADGLVSQVQENEPQFSERIWTPEAAIAHAQSTGTTDGPIVLADTQDNPGAGGNGDTVGILKALIAADAQDAALGVLYDSAAAGAAHKAGLGAKVRLELGSHTGGAPNETPVSEIFTVLQLSDGNFEATGPFYDGAHMSLGRSAILGIGGVKVVVGSKKAQCADQAMFTHLGLNPTQQKIVVVKSSVHFRADFGPIASEVLVVASPGPNPADHRELTYKNLRTGVRLMPGSVETS